MIGVVIPVHNEEKSLAACLEAAQVAAKAPGLQGEAVRIVVVLDGCTDRSADVAARFEVDVLCVSGRSVGHARAAGAAWLIERNARWLAFSDGDSVVDAGWLVAQLHLDAEVVCGTVEVMDWGAIPPHVQLRYRMHYRDHDGHRHIHGANLGLCAKAYVRAGGFRNLRCNEDVELVHALLATGSRVSWSAAPRVRTSGRLVGRLSGGFADHLSSLNALLLPLLPEDCDAYTS
jgi:glycosyltransferase involved in cell wall biosynthesis